MCNFYSYWIKVEFEYFGIKIDNYCWVFWNSDTNLQTMYYNDRIVGT